MNSNNLHALFKFRFDPIKTKLEIAENHEIRLLRKKPETLIEVYNLNSNTCAKIINLITLFFRHCIFAYRIKICQIDNYTQPTQGNEIRS